MSSTVGAEVPVVCIRGMVINKKDITTKEQSEIKKELTVKPFSMYAIKNNVPVPSYKVYRETPSELIIPVHYGTKKFSKYTVKYQKMQLTDIPDCSGELRETQLEAYGKCKGIFDGYTGGGILSLSTGQGKTFCAIKLITEVKLKTLIIVNKVELMNQWKREIEKFAPGTKVGTIQGPVFDTEDKHIVIGMLQTISKREELTPDKFKDFNFTVLDEVHNSSAELFSNVFYRVSPRYKLGLSATVERQDKLEKIFLWHCGDVLYKSESSTKQESLIYQHRYYPTTIHTGSNDDVISTVITEISQDPSRNKVILDLIRKTLYNDQRKILVLSDRVNQLQILQKDLGDNLSGLVIGKMKSVDIEISKTKRVLLATYSLANEGFSLAALNTLLLATPRSSVTQSVGRIFRKIHLIQPLIIDIVDSAITVLSRQATKRKSIYKKEISKCNFVSSLDSLTETTSVSISPQKPSSSCDFVD